jgi:hypothetical protein
MSFLEVVCIFVREENNITRIPGDGVSMVKGL